MLKLPCGYFDLNASGRLVSKLIFDVEQIAGAVTQGLVTVLQNSGQARSAVRVKTVARGSRTMRLRYAQVIPSESPNPGSTLRDVRRIVIPSKG